MENFQRRVQVYSSFIPVRQQNHRTLQIHVKMELRKKIENFLELQLSEPCPSAHNSPVMLIPNKSGELRLFIGYQQLNKQTKKPCWPMPSFEKVFELSDISCYFSTMTSLGDFITSSFKKVRTIKHPVLQLDPLNGRACHWVLPVVKASFEFYRKANCRSDMVVHIAFFG